MLNIFHSWHSCDERRDENREDQGAIPELRIHIFHSGGFKAFVYIWKDQVTDKTLASGTTEGHT